MVARLALWSLADSTATVDELREALRESAGESPGLLFGAFVSDETTDRFGLFQLWSSREGAEQPVPDRVREAIGADPQIAELFDLEATASAVPELDRLGLAFG